MIDINDRGNNNKIMIHPDYQRCNFGIICNGDNNQVSFDQPTAVQEFNCINICLFGSGSKITIGRIYANSLTIHSENGLQIKCGNQTSFNRVFISSNEPAEIQIGSECLFASDIKIYPTDFHKISVDGKRINNPKPIRIGNKVWVCDNTILLKGADVEDGAVIGAGAVVAGKIPARTIAAGNPIRIIRENIEWQE